MGQRSQKGRLPSSLGTGAQNDSDLRYEASGPASSLLELEHEPGEGRGLGFFRPYFSNGAAELQGERKGAETAGLGETGPGAVLSASPGLRSVRPPHPTRPQTAPGSSSRIPCRRGRSSPEREREREESHRPLEKAHQARAYTEPATPDRPATEKGQGDRPVTPAQSQCLSHPNASAASQLPSR